MDLVNYTPPQVLVDQKYVSAATSASEPILSACVVAPSFQIKRDVRVSEFMASMNVDTAYRDDYSNCGPAETQFIDFGKDSQGEYREMSVEMGLGSDTGWAFIRDYSDDYPSEWDNITSKSDDEDRADYIVIFSATGYSSIVVKQIEEVVDDPQGGSMLKVSSSGMNPTQDANYYIVSPVFEDVSSSLPPDFTGGGGGEDSEVQEGDYICLTREIDEGSSNYYRFPVYLKVKKVLGETQILVDYSSVVDIRHGTDLAYDIYKKANVFLPVKFKLPDLELGAIFFDPYGLVYKLDSSSNPARGDLKNCNPILKVTSNVTTKYIPIDCYEVVEDEDGTPLVIVNQNFEMDDIRLGWATARSDVSLPAVESGSYKFTDNSQDFISLGVTRGDIVEIDTDSFGRDPETITNRAKVVAVDNAHQLTLVLPGFENVQSPLYRIIQEEFEEGYITCSYRAQRTSYVGGMVRASNYLELNSLIPPVSPENPLAWGMWMALNHTGQQVSGTMTDEIIENTYYDVRRGSGDSLGIQVKKVQQGSVASFDRALEYLEGQEVYAIHPMSYEGSVHQSLFTHIVKMSVPERKRERIGLITPRLWTAEVRVEENYGGTVEVNNYKYEKFSIGEESDIDFLSRGVLPGEWLQILSPAGLVGSYRISDVGAKFLILSSPVSGVTSEVTGLTWRIISNMYDKTEQALKIASYADSFAGGVDESGDPAYNDRRLLCIWPDYMSQPDISGDLESWYLASGVSGMVSGYAPQQGFTNLSMNGYDSLRHSNLEYFTDEQLNMMAPGGVYIIVQDREGEPVYCRHQLTCAFDLISTRELSIVKNVDFIAKFIRIGLKGYIGKYNITETFKSILKMATQSLINWLKKSGSLKNATIDQLIVDEDNPDTILIHLSLDVPYPCNYIKVTLFI